jgi:hypothetical protein
MARPGDLRRARIRFAMVFAVVGGGLLAAYSFPYAQHGVREDWFARYLAVYARLAGGVLRLFDSGVHLVGNDIVGRTSLTVAKNCDAMDVSLLFAAAVVAFPARWSRRDELLARARPLATPPPSRQKLELKLTPPSHASVLGAVGAALRKDRNIAQSRDGVFIVLPRFVGRPLPIVRTHDVPPRDLD